MPTTPAASARPSAVVARARLEHLAVRGLVGEERELREDDAERAGDEQLEPGVAEQDEAGDGAAEAHEHEEQCSRSRAAAEQTASRTLSAGPNRCWSACWTPGDGRPEAGRVRRRRSVAGCDATDYGLPRVCRLPSRGGERCALGCSDRKGAPWVTVVRRGERRVIVPEACQGRGGKLLGFPDARKEVPCLPIPTLPAARATGRSRYSARCPPWRWA